jgi:hypothetical protein
VSERAGAPVALITVAEQCAFVLAELTAHAKHQPWLCLK